jgi:hypothetical protein
MEVVSEVEENEIRENEIRLKEEQLNTALQLCNTCDLHKDHQYTHLNKVRSITACGYTAPALAVTILFLEHYGINKLEDLNSVFINETGECIKLTPELLTAGVNAAVGYLWNLHSGLGVGLDVIVRSHYHLLKQELQVGVNYISFIKENYTVHHSLIYTLDKDVCFIMDSWGEYFQDGTTFFRVPSIRRHSTSAVVEHLRYINEYQPDQADALHKVMKHYFLAPENRSYDKLMVVVLDHNFLVNIAKQGFFEGCHGVRRWGGKYIRKRKTNKKFRKRYIKNKIKRKKSKRKVYFLHPSSKIL